jgi:hypothetical protein
VCDGPIYTNGMWLTTCLGREVDGDDKVGVLNEMNWLGDKVGFKYEVFVSLSGTHSRQPSDGSRAGYEATWLRE